VAAAIPVIDLAGALAPGAPRSAEVARAIGEAARGSGFFYVENHGVPPALVAAQFEAARAFFALPTAAKAAVALDGSPSMRGYESIGSQTLDGDARPDLKESFYCGVEHPPTHAYVRKGYQSYGANRWPEGLPALVPQCAAYTEALRGLAKRVMQLLALSLGLDERHFDAVLRDPMVTLRLLRYPPHPENADALTFGAGAHTDWGAVTLLAQDAFGGLEVRMPDGAWVPATPIPGTFVVNLGDMIPRWTNGRYHSNPHRVRNVHSGGRARHSIPFFFSPDYEARIEALPGTLAPGEAPIAEPCTAGEHLREMAERTYGRAPTSKPIETAAA
jgi:isopenicillin N synthase-like dioxygenase